MGECLSREPYYIHKHTKNIESKHFVSLLSHKNKAFEPSAHSLSQPLMTIFGYKSTNFSENDKEK